MTDKPVCLQPVTDKIREHKRLSPYVTFGPGYCILNAPVDGDPADCLRYRLNEAAAFQIISDLAKHLSDVKRKERR